MGRNVWDRLAEGARPVNKLAKAVARKADIDDLPPADKTFRPDPRRGRFFLEGFRAAMDGKDAGTCPYRDGRRTDWFDGFDEACLQRSMRENNGD